MIKNSEMKLLNLITQISKFVNPKKKKKTSLNEHLKNSFITITHILIGLQTQNK
jgi:hypothetical protein